MKTNLDSWAVRKVLAWLQRYDHNSYWRMRNEVTRKGGLRSLKLCYLFLIKRSDAFNNCSFGTDLEGGAVFAGPPKLPHGPNGIIVGHDCVIGSNVTIYHQVTIMHGNVRVGNRVLIGAGAKILPGVSIGDGAKIGSNCVVVEDVPENATVVLTKPRVLIRSGSNS